MFSKKLLIPLLSLSLLVTPAYSSHAAENTEAVETSVEGQGMLSPSSSSENSESVFNGSGAGTSSEPVTDEKLETENAGCKPDQALYHGSCLREL